MKDDLPTFQIIMFCGIELCAVGILYIMRFRNIGILFSYDSEKYAVNVMRRDLGNIAGILYRCHI